MAILEDVLREAGFSDKAIAEVKDGKLHYGGSLDAASDKELSVKLAFHVKAKLSNAKDIFIGDPKKKVCCQAYPHCRIRGTIFCHVSMVASGVWLVHNSSSFIFLSLAAINVYF